MIYNFNVILQNLISLFEDIFVFDTILGLYTIQKSSHRTNINMF